jgi:hypothetical protein
LYKQYLIEAARAEQSAKTAQFLAVAAEPGAPSQPANDHRQRASSKRF